VDQTKPTKAKKANGDPGLDSANAEGKPKGSDSESFIGACVFSYHFLLTYLLFGLVLWAWFTQGRGSLLPRFEIAARFDAKVSAHDALSRMTDCFYTKIPDRNATVEDFTMCAMRLGLPHAPASNFSS
jgi:hypothetical protein